MVVAIRSGTVESTVVVSPAGRAAAGLTVEGLFRDVRHRLEGRCNTTVEYDRSRGLPTHVYSDCGTEGDGWLVRDFAAELSPDAGPWTTVDRGGP